MPCVSVFKSIRKGRGIGHPFMCEGEGRWGEELWEGGSEVCVGSISG